MSSPSEATIVFRCCKECGSAEEVNAHQPYCPGCGASYLEQAEARIRELEALLNTKRLRIVGLEDRIAKAKAILETAKAILETMMGCYLDVHARTQVEKVLQALKGKDGKE